MSVTVVGSIAFDAVKTPFGERERMLGGSAVHFALAASFFDMSTSSARSATTSARTSTPCCAPAASTPTTSSTCAGGQTFFWQGEYGWDLNDRRDARHAAGVFEDFEPKLSATSRSAELLFLANIQPDLQRDVRAQCAGARFVAMDSMNLWIEVARDSLIETISGVDCLLLNDAELRQLTEEPNLVLAARECSSGARA